MHDLLNHLRYAMRQLRRNPGFALTAILTLAVGIGATTAIFSIVDAVLLQPLPYAEPDRLVVVKPQVSLPGSSALTDNEISYPNFRDWRDEAHSFESIAAYNLGSKILNAMGTNSARTLQTGVVTSDFFHVLRITPALGRDFTRSEEKAGNRVAILSHELWVSAFHASPSIRGHRITVSDELYTVIGVLPQGASFPFADAAPIDLWTTSAVEADGKNPSTEQRGWNQLDTVARLKPGVTINRAQAEMNAIQRTLAVRYPEDDANATGARVTPLLDQLVGDVRPALRMLFAAVAALLLIACANVAGLLLARGSSRQSELAVRAALGATRAEITMQLLTESVVLSLIGGAAGTLIASLILTGILRFAPADLPRLDHVAINGPVLAFAIGLSVLTGIVFGLLPARRLAMLDPAVALRDGTRTSTAGRSRHRLHSALVVTETALGLVLLIGAGLLMRSFQRLLATDPGFNPRHTLTFRVGVTAKSYPPEKRREFYDRLLARLSSLPGTKSASAAFPLPFSGNDMTITFDIQGRPVERGKEPDARVSIVEPQFFETLQIPLLRGRFLTPSDNQETAPPVIVVNRELARKYFPGEDALGKRIQTGFDGAEDGQPAKWREIVGIVGDVKRTRIAERPEPEYYLPFGQVPVANPFLAMRVTGNPASYANAVRSAVASLDKELPIYHVHTLDENVAAASAQPRFQAMLLTGFAAVALLLAAIGLYAVLSYMVVQRTHEIGLRIALGAQRGGVVQLVMRRGMKLALAGLAIGIVISIGLTRLVAGQLYEIKPLDPVTYFAVAAVLLAVSGLASLIPAARAARLDPMLTLRDQ